MQTIENTIKSSSSFEMTESSENILQQFDLHLIIVKKDVSFMYPKYIINEIFREIYIFYETNNKSSVSRTLILM